MRKKHRNTDTRFLKIRQLTLKPIKSRIKVDVEKMEILEQTRGYVHVHIEPGEDSTGPIIGVAKNSKDCSICLFIAGGKGIDEKVAQANAALRIAVDGKIK